MRMFTLLFMLLGLTLVSLSATDAQAQPATTTTEYVKLEVRGTVVNFATKEGETGILIQTKALTFQLDFGGNAATAAEAKKIDGKQAIVLGQLVTRELDKNKAVTFIRVSSLQPVK